MRNAALALVLAVAAPLAGGQQKTPQQTDKPIIEGLPPGAVLKPVGRQGPHKSENTTSLTPDAFERLFSSGGDPWAVVSQRPAASSTDGTISSTRDPQPSLRLCKTWISAAAALSDETFEQLNVSLYEEVPEHLHSCVAHYPTLTASDLRKATRAIYRFDQADEGLFLAVNVDRGKRLAAQQSELDSAKASLAEVVGRYNALVSDYNHLNEANGQLFRTAQITQSECAASATRLRFCHFTGFPEWHRCGPAVRQLHAPPQPTVCRTELIGWTLVTKCQ